MAHMPDRAERIDISPECEVRMLTTDGSDLHRIDKAAGASRVLPGRTDGNPPSASALLHLFQPFPVHLPPLYLRHPQTMFIQQFAQPFPVYQLHLLAPGALAWVFALGLKCPVVMTIPWSTSLVIDPCISRTTAGPTVPLQRFAWNAT